MTLLYESETSRLIILDNALYFEKKEPQESIFEPEDLKEEDIPSWANTPTLIAEEITELTSTINWGTFDVCSKSTYGKNDVSFVKSSKRISPMSSPLSYAGVGRAGYPRLYFADNTFIVHSHKGNMITEKCYACETVQNQ